MEWFKEVRTAKIPLNGYIIKEKALGIAERLKLQGLSASNGWIDRFEKRNNLYIKSICGESGSVDIEIVQLWKENTLPNLLKDCIPRDIFNADETGLFFNLLPDKTLTVKGENCQEGKFPKMRLTVLLCTNADGSEKLTPLVIGRAKKPRCFKNVKSLSTDYTWNKKARMTQSVFEDFLRKLDKKMRLQKLKIILFIDNCTPHLDLKLKNMRVEFVPTNCTSQLQPLDLGIIRSFKAHYRKQLVRKLLLFLGSGDLQDASEAKTNVLEALNVISAAWDSVDKKCVTNSFNKAGVRIQKII
ncbi:Tigger transposable element-derived protein 6 [Araneus ventricosus]|uniref:Tigger transposable element-derived protein 6 n=1 Tax=Araneus ventricosus TaxID=182803 RepID=A0A4Y2APS0_ARAVE|nr:Tigger transposable element-derived protein 6 [Araneus ventricosus]